MSNYSAAYYAIFVVCSFFVRPDCYGGISEEQCQKKLKDWVIGEVHRLSQKNLTDVENVDFGQIYFGEKKVKRKNIEIFDGIFTDSSATQKLVCITVDKHQKTSGHGLNEALILLVNKQTGTNGYKIIRGRPSSRIKEKNLIDFDADGFLDVFCESTTLKDEVECRHQVRIISLKKSKVLYSTHADDKWTKASAMQQVLFVSGDKLYETIEVSYKKVKGKYELREERTEYICAGGETPAQIKRTLKKNKSTKLITCTNDELAIVTSDKQ